MSTNACAYRATDGLRPGLRRQTEHASLRSGFPSRNRFLPSEHGRDRASGRADHVPCCWSLPDQTVPPLACRLVANQAPGASGRCPVEAFSSTGPTSAVLRSLNFFEGSSERRREVFGAGTPGVCRVCRWFAGVFVVCAAECACSANLPGLPRRKSGCESVVGIRTDVSAPHDGSQERQDAQLLASGALGASRPQGGAGDGGAAWRARRAGTRAGSQPGAADHGSR